MCSMDDPPLDPFSVDVVGPDLAPERRLWAGRGMQAAVEAFDRTTVDLPECIVALRYRGRTLWIHRAPTMRESITG